MTNKNDVFTAQLPQDVAFNVYRGRKFYFRTNRLEKAYSFNLEKIDEFLSQKFTVKYSPKTEITKKMYLKVLKPNNAIFFAEIEVPGSETQELPKLLKVRAKEHKAYINAELRSEEFEISKFSYSKLAQVFYELTSEIFRREFTEDEKLLVKKLLFLKFNKISEEEYLEYLEEDLKVISYGISKDSFTKENLPKFFLLKMKYMTKYFVDPIKYVELFYNPKKGFKKRYVIVTSLSGEKVIFENGDDGFNVF